MASLEYKKFKTNWSSFDINDGRLSVYDDNDDDNNDNYNEKNMEENRMKQTPKAMTNRQLWLAENLETVLKTQWAAQSEERKREEKKIYI
jgi:hypothetical protein